jgi:hypothetical protein
MVSSRESIGNQKSIVFHTMAATERRPKKRTYIGGQVIEVYLLNK